MRGLAREGLGVQAMLELFEGFLGATVLEVQIAKGSGPGTWSALRLVSSTRSLAPVATLRTGRGVGAFPSLQLPHVFADACQSWCQ